MRRRLFLQKSIAALIMQKNPWKLQSRNRQLAALIMRKKNPENFRIEIDNTLGEQVNK